MGNFDRKNWMIELKLRENLSDSRILDYVETHSDFTLKEWRAFKKTLPEHLSNAKAEQIVRFFVEYRDGVLMPDRFGFAEPIRNHFSVEAIPDAISLLCWPGAILSLKKLRKYDVFIENKEFSIGFENDKYYPPVVKHGEYLATITMWVSKTKVKDCQSLFSLADDMFEGLGAAKGAVIDQENLHVVYGCGGDNQAQQMEEKRNLGWKYYSGTGVEQDDQKAFELFLEAAEYGDEIAQFNVGFMYYSGRYVAQDYSKAAEWYRKSADRGYVEAQYNLALMYDHGLGVEQNFWWAFTYYSAAALQGDASAQYNVACMYDNGQGVAQDKSKALEWYMKSAEQGNSNAQYNLGCKYVNGDGVQKDYAKAAEWYRKAASQGDELAQSMLEQMNML